MLRKMILATLVLGAVIFVTGCKSSCPTASCTAEPEVVYTGCSVCDQ